MWLAALTVLPSGGVGQHVTEALIAAGFKVIVLLRKVRALTCISASLPIEYFT